MNLLLFSLLSTSHILIQSVAGCGFPGAPAHSTVTFSTDVVGEGTVATYTCDPGLQLLGPEQKRCHSNTSWVPDGIPFCVINVAAGKAPMQSSTAQGGIPQKAVDGSTSGFYNPNTCTLTEPESQPLWYVNLLEPFVVQLVRIDFGRSCCQNNVPVTIVVRVGNNRPDLGENPVCNRFIGFMEEGRPLFLPCSPPIPGAFVSVHLEGPAGQPLSICETFVYTDQAVPVEQCPYFSDQPPGASVTYNGRCYTFYNREPRSFVDAQELCLDRGGSLIDDSSPALQGFLSWELWRRHRSDPTGQYWMGAVRDPQTFSAWRWINGRDVSLSFWSPPSGQGNCARFDGSKDWLWSETDCNLPLNFICQHEPLTCGRPEQPPNSSLLAVDFGVGTAIQYRCQEGHLLEGPQERICLTTGFYSGFPPTCKSVECGMPAPIDNGSYRLQNGSRGFGALVRYSCEPGHVMLGRGDLLCAADQRWNGPPPSCQPRLCKDPPIILNGGFRLLNGTSHVGSLVEYFCQDTRFLLNGPITLQCTSDGTYDQKPPVCRELSLSDEAAIDGDKSLLLSASEFQTVDSVQPSPADRNSSTVVSQGIFAGDRVFITQGLTDDKKRFVVIQKQRLGGGGLGGGDLTVSSSLENKERLLENSDHQGFQDLFQHLSLDTSEPLLENKEEPRYQSLNLFPDPEMLEPLLENNSERFETEFRWAQPDISKIAGPTVQSGLGQQQLHQGNEFIESSSPISDQSYDYTNGDPNSQYTIIDDYPTGDALPQNKFTKSDVSPYVDDQFGADSGDVLTNPFASLDYQQYYWDSSSTTGNTTYDISEYSNDINSQTFNQDFDNQNQPLPPDGAFDYLTGNSNSKTDYSELDSTVSTDVLGSQVVKRGPPSPTSVSQADFYSPSLQSNLVTTEETRFNGVATIRGSQQHRNGSSQFSFGEHLDDHTRNLLPADGENSLDNAFWRHNTSSGNRASQAVGRAVAVPTRSQISSLSATADPLVEETSVVEPVASVIPRLRSSVANSVATRRQVTQTSGRLNVKPVGFPPESLNLTVNTRGSPVEEIPAASDKRQSVIKTSAALLFNEIPLSEPSDRAAGIGIGVPLKVNPVNSADPSIGTSSFPSDAFSNIFSTKVHSDLKEFPNFPRTAFEAFDLTLTNEVPVSRKTRLRPPVQTGTELFHRPLVTVVPAPGTVAAAGDAAPSPPGGVVFGRAEENEIPDTVNIRQNRQPGINVPDSRLDDAATGAKLNLGGIVALGVFGGFVFLAAVVTTIVIIVRRGRSRRGRRGGGGRGRRQQRLAAGGSGTSDTEDGALDTSVPGYYRRAWRSVQRPARSDVYRDDSELTVTDTATPHQSHQHPQQSQRDERRHHHHHHHNRGQHRATRHQHTRRH